MEYDKIWSKQERCPQRVYWEFQPNAALKGFKRLRSCQVGESASLDIPGRANIYHLGSALEDHRFSPITTSELSSLSCGYVESSTPHLHANLTSGYPS
jgi:hypothetical protein